MNETERERIRGKLLRLVREEPELIVGLLLGLMDGGRFEVVVREERSGAEGNKQGVSFSSGETAVMGYEIERKG